MSKCSVKKMKVTFNNPNLPILEVMQQFTLNAIALSGNNSMTDSQKVALNHFFYQIGAIGNTALWQKVKYLFLPMICGDNVETAMNDYVSNTVIAAQGSPTFVNHGLHYSETSSSQIIGTDIFSGSSFNLSVLTATMGNSFVIAPDFVVMLDKGDAAQRRTFGGVNLNSTSSWYIGGLPGFTLNTPNVSDLIYDCGVIVNSPNSAYMKIGTTINDNYIKKDATASDLSSRSSEIVYSNNYLRINMGRNNIDLGLVMIAEAMSDEESTLMLGAIKGLKLAFSESNT